MNINDKAKMLIGRGKCIVYYECIDTRPHPQFLVIVRSYLKDVYDFLESIQSDFYNGIEFDILKDVAKLWDKDIKASGIREFIRTNLKESLRYELL